jgi:hypothetical protein
MSSGSRFRAQRSRTTRAARRAQQRIRLIEVAKVIQQTHVDPERVLERMTKPADQAALRRILEEST